MPMKHNGSFFRQSVWRKQSIITITLNKIIKIDTEKREFFKCPENIQEIYKKILYLPIRNKNW